MKTSEGLSYQVLTILSLAVIGVAAAIGISWMESRYKAVPLQPAPVAEWAAPDTSRKEAVSVQRAQIITHTVAEGETITHIAELYQLDTDTIYGANWEVTDLIHPGDQLIILPCQGVLHSVAESDTLWSLSILYGVDADIIIKANNLSSNVITVGQSLFIPGGKLARSPNMPSRGGAVRFLWPSIGELSSGFGYRWGTVHTGVDIAADTGTRVTASSGGHVTYAGWYGGYGYTVAIDHGQGYSTLYAHLSDYSTERGDYVAAGQVIGYVGSTGNSTGPHLHFEVRHHAIPVNPLALLP